MTLQTAGQVSTRPRSVRRPPPGFEGEPGTRGPGPGGLGPGRLGPGRLGPGGLGPGGLGPGGLGTDTLGHATLSPAGLGQLVSEIAAEQSWRSIVRFSAERRWYRRLVLADDHEIWLLSWLPGQHTGFHDHGEARGAFAVAQGELRETLAQPGRNRVRNRRASAGSLTTFGARHLHDVSNAATAPAISVHAYSPPLTAMRRYEMTAAGLALVATDRAELDW
ncbi:MAG TPA: cysteine dioxygenase family protein [Streptosporangiaceae bacterium]|nr:cysteine dioxygenase family protein [Streptosporangiaceae bacterium]